MKKLSILLLFLAGSVYSQNCDCKRNLKLLIDKVKNDYPGFVDKVNVNTRKEYDFFTKKMIAKASQTGTFNRCSVILDDWLKFFKDEHLHLSIEINRFWTFKKINDSTTMLRLPSFRYDAKPLIDSLISTNLKEITSAPNFIIDVRGNGGGLDYSYQKLLPLLYTGPYIDETVEWYASAGNIKRFEDDLASGKIRKGTEAWTRKLIKLMKEKPGSFVIIDPADTVKEDTIYPYPKKVGVIIDDFCGSSCEAFILDAKHSKKVTVFGCRTFGVLDYSNTSPEDLGLKGLSVYIPKTRSTRLPENPIDNVGIPPDVEINLPYNLNVCDKIDDWVIFVKDWLEKNK
jgi:hypothetical protein